MSKSNDVKKYSAEQNLNYNKFLEFIGLVELRHLLRFYEMNPNPKYTLKVRIEEIWGKDIQNNHQHILDRYSEQLKIYNFIKKQDKFNIYNNIKRIVDNRIRKITYEEEDYKDDFLNRVMSIQRKEDELIKEELNHLHKIAMKDPFSISELQVYYIVEEILNNNYIDYETNQFLKIESKKIKRKEIEGTGQFFIKSLIENKENFTVDMYCQKHDNIFCKQCYYGKDFHKESMMQYYFNKGDLKLLTLYKLINSADTIDTHAEYNEILTDIKNKLKIKYMI